MGRVIPYIDIETNRLPNEATFDTAVTAFSDLVDEAITEGTVDGAFIFGSVAVGRATARSDFDAFVMLPEAHIDNYQAAQRIFQLVASETLWLIPVSPIIQTKEALAEGRHEMDRFFCEHLMGDYRFVRGSDPASIVKTKPVPAQTILSDYLTHKKRRISNDFAGTTPEEVREGKSLQRLLELPQAIGRKSIQALIDVDVIEQDLSDSADKQMVLQASSVLFSMFGLSEGFENLLTMHKQYEEVFFDAINGSVDQSTYEAVLRELHEQIPHALIWLDQVETVLLPKVE